MGVPSGFEVVARGEAPPLHDEEIHLWHTRSVAAAHARAHARATLHALLGAYIGTPDIEFGSGVHGKPYAHAVGGIEFNLSHAGEDIVIAFARGQALGVDIERWQRRAVSPDVAQRFFCASEAAALDKLPEARRQMAFLRLWTHKEAVLKAIGGGLSFGLARLEFALDADGDVLGLRDIAGEAGAAADWRLHPFALDARLVGCLAWHGATRRVRTVAWAS